MKILVVYYSRSGNTRKVALELAGVLQADTEEIVDVKKRSGILGYIFGGRDAVKKKATEIGRSQKSPENYDLVMAGTPIWGWTLTPAVRTYLTDNAKKIKKLAAFCTEGGSGGSRSFDEMEKITGLKPLAVLEIKTGQLASGIYQSMIQDFCRQVTGG